MKLALLLVTAWLMIHIVGLALDPYLVRLSPTCQLALFPAGLFVVVAAASWVRERRLQ